VIRVILGVGSDLPESVEEKKEGESLWGADSFSATEDESLAQWKNLGEWSRESKQIKAGKREFAFVKFQSRRTFVH